MRRTKQWWASLTKEERSELHHLAYANSDWMNRKRLEPMCGYCGTDQDGFGLCPKCDSRRKELINKANEAIQCNPR